MQQRTIVDTSGREWVVRGLPPAGADGPHPVPRIEFRHAVTGELRVCPAPRMPEEMTEHELLDRLHLLLAQQRLSSSERRPRRPRVHGTS